MEQLEKYVLSLIATERVYRPITSMSGKLDRRRPKIAKAIDLTEWKGEFTGERAYARVEIDDKAKSKALKPGVDRFCEEHPKYGAILQDLIEEERSHTETHLYFGMNQGCRLTEADYLGVMKDLGFTDAVSKKLYPQIIEISRVMARKREETESRILIGQANEHY